MTTGVNEIERRGQRRRLIFTNVANGVPLTAIRRALKATDEEITREAMFVARKINEYRFRRLSDGSDHARAVLNIQTLADIRAKRLNLFETLNKIGNVTLGTELLVPSLTIQNIDEYTIKDAQERLEEA